MRIEQHAVRITTAQWLIIGFLVCGTLFFGIVNDDWGLWNGFYYSWVTLTTIGASSSL